MVAVLASVASQASENGRNGFSGNPTANGGATCAVCHASAAGSPAAAVSLTGPVTVDAGTSHTFTARLSGGPGVTGGINISTTESQGQLQAIGGDLVEIAGELSHSAPKGFSDGSVEFAFRWTAPAYNTEVTLHTAGNSTNGQLDLLGDGIATDALRVTVVNGVAPPPPVPPPLAASIALDVVATGLSSPVVITHAGDQRLFIVERRGRIRIIDQGGTLLAAPFLDIRSRVDDSGNEMGLLGLAFHPDYAANGFFYVYYTFDPGPGLDRSRISRFQVTADGNSAAPASETVLMEFSQPYSNHNGGDLHFGPDGFLYIASGDGGSGGDPQNYAQNDRSPLGKLLRIDVDAQGATGLPDCNLAAGANYRIPSSNAYADGPGGVGCDEIYANGLRNPWRFSFDRDNGDLWIADVGQGAREEVNHLLAGADGGVNFGWRCYEGTRPYNLTGCAGTYFAPLHEYAHSGGNCSVTGGYVYRGAAYPELQGRYFFSDFCRSSIRTISGLPGIPQADDVLPAGVISAPSAFGEDVDGELYVASLNTGVVYKIRALGSAPPPEEPPRVALAVGVTDNGQYGNRYGSDEHETELIATFARTDRDLELTLEGYDIDFNDEVSVSLNGNPLGHLLEGPNNRLNAGDRFLISADAQTREVNEVRFAQRTPGWIWGVTKLALGEPSVPLELVVGVPDPGAYGNRFGSDQNRTELAAMFMGTEGNLQLAVTGYDIDFADEVQVLLNGNPLGYLDRGPNNGLNDGTVFAIPEGVQNTGANMLRFVQGTPGWIWGVTDLLLSEAGVVPGDLSLCPGVPHTGSYGNRFGTDAHFTTLTVTFEGTNTLLELSVRGYDVDYDDEVAVYLNDSLLGHLRPGSDNQLNAGDTFAIPAASQLPGTNWLRFQERTPGWIWGVADLRLVDPAVTGDIGLCPGVPDPGQYGNGYGTNQNETELAATFQGTSDLVLAVAGYDIDFDDEVAVYLNDNLLGYLSRGPNNRLNGGDEFDIPAGSQLPGGNTVRFVERTAGWIWGVTNLHLRAAP